MLFFCRFPLKSRFLKEFKIKKWVVFDTTDDVKRDINGYNRYYDSVVSYGGKKYIICSQWVDNLHQNSVAKWIKEKMVNILIDLVKNISVGEKFEIRSLLQDYWYDIDCTIRRVIGKEFKTFILENRLAELGEIKKEAQVYIKL